MGEVGAVHQVLVDADGTVEFAASAEQGTQSEMQLQGVRVHLGHLQKCLDGLVGLLIEQIVQALEVGTRHRPRLVHDVTDVHACCGPAEGKE